jgi:spermidine synthase
MPVEEPRVFDARTRRSFLQLAAVASGCAFAVEAAAAQPKELVRESIYNYIIVSRSGSVVSFRRMENGASISAIDMSRPSYQVIDYAKFLFAGALVDPNPSNVLSIGLGAGSFNRLFNLLYPDAVLTTVEIDPMIRDLAVEFTDFQESPKNKVVIEDGRRFLRRSAEYWNWIVVDAFVKNSQYPPHMATREFFSLIASHLSPGGILLINVLQGSKLFDCMIATISSVFPRLASLEVPGRGNAIVIGSGNDGPSIDQKINAASISALPLLGQNGVDVVQIKTAAATPTSVSCPGLLTDDFSPTEFLGNQWRK